MLREEESVLRPGWHVAVLAFFALTTVLTALPPPGSWTSSLPSVSPTDECELVWYLWHVKLFALGQAEDLYHTRHIYYPSGTTLALSPMPLLPAFAFLPVTMLWEGVGGLFLSFNLIVLVSFVLTGYFVFLLVHRVSGSAMAGFVGGTLVALHPYSFKHLGHLHILSFYWVPLFVYSVWCLWESGSVKSSLLAWASVIGCALTSLTYFVHLLGLFLIFVPVGFALERHRLRKGRFREGLAVLAVGVVMTSLLVVLVVWLAGPTVDVSKRAIQMSRFTVDLESFAIPHYGSILAEWAARLGNPVSSEMKGKAYLGGTLVVLSFLGLLRARGRERWIWLGIAGAFAVLSLGPSLKIGRSVYCQGLLPYAWLHKWVPVFSEDRAPERFFRTAHLALALLASGGFIVVFEFVQKRVGRAAVFLLPVILSAVVVEYLPMNIEFWSPEVPAAYDAVARDPDSVAVCPLPDVTGMKRSYMFYQTSHGKPITGGRIARPSIGAGLMVDGARIEAVMFPLSPRWDPEKIDEIRRVLVENRVKYVMYHEGGLHPSVYRAHRARLGQWLEVVEESDGAVLYRVF